MSAVKRRRRIRSPHPGVKLNARTLPSGAKQWRARYRDPDSGKLVDTTLDAQELRSAEARKAWAVQKSKALAARRMALESGAPVATGKQLDAAIDGYVSAAKHRLRPKTIETHGLAIARLRAWARRDGVRSTSDLTRPRLQALRDYLIAAPRAGVAKGGRRGERQAAERKRSPVSVNRELRSLKTMFNTWRLGGLLPHVDRDGIADTLKSLPVTLEQPGYLAPAALAKLLRAALRHDADVFAATRAEHAGNAEPGSTRRYDAIAPFAAALLLSGMRRGEALGLRWGDVDLEALDAQGRTVGEIRLKGSTTKTHRARTIGLEVSPALRSLLAAMKLRAGKEAVHVFERAAEGEREPYSADLAGAARKRLLAEYGAPPYDWQTLRSTCATYLTNAPAIFGAATVYLSARQLGHSVAVAERHYLGVHRGVSLEARSLEAAMQIEPVLAEVIASVGASGRPQAGEPRARA